MIDSALKMSEFFWCDISEKIIDMVDHFDLYEDESAVFLENEVKFSSCNSVIAHQKRISAILIILSCQSLSDVSFVFVVSHGKYL